MNELFRRGADGAARFEATACSERVSSNATSCEKVGQSVPWKYTSTGSLLVAFVLMGMNTYVVSVSLRNKPKFQNSYIPKQTIFTRRPWDGAPGARRNARRAILPASCKSTRKIENKKWMKHLRGVYVTEVRRRRRDGRTPAQIAERRIGEGHAAKVDDARRGVGLAGECSVCEWTLLYTCAELKRL